MATEKTRLVLTDEHSFDAARERAKRAVLTGKTPGVVIVADGARVLYECWSDGGDFYERRYETEESRRRGRRIELEIPVELACETSVDGGRTVDVSGRGALVLTATQYPPDSLVRLKNLDSGGAAVGRVVWSIPGKLGLELVDEATPGFWGPDLEHRLNPDA
jgi:hypothetical protein